MRRMQHLLFGLLLRRLLHVSSLRLLPGMQYMPKVRCLSSVYQPVLTEEAE